MTRAVRARATVVGHSVRLNEAHMITRRVLAGWAFVTVAVISPVLAEPAVREGISGPVDKMMPPVLPEYTDAEKQAGHYGVVTVEGDLQTDGTLAGVHVVHTTHAADLDAAAVEAVAKWKFIL